MYMRKHEKQTFPKTHTLIIKSILKNRMKHYFKPHKISLLQGQCTDEFCENWHAILNLNKSLLDCVTLH